MIQSASSLQTLEKSENVRLITSVVGMNLILATEGLLWVSVFWLVGAKVQSED